MCRQTIFPLAILIAAAVPGNPGYAQPQGEEASMLPEDYSCSLCHSKEGDLWNESTPAVEPEDLAGDVHWQEGLLCHDCHGGGATLDTFKNHREDPSFRTLRSPDQVPEFCGHCHSSIEYMRDYNPSARTDQVAEYWTSGHGKRLRASAEDEESEVDQGVATCIDCHGGHGILKVKDPQSRVYPTNVAQTCAECHSDQTLMAGRTYHGRPVGHSQYEQWRRGVHGRALMEKGDLSAATCNDCHGNHGAMPPGVASVANACGTCHGKVSDLFADTRMRHRFEEVGLPGCATCHGTHETLQPSDEMLSMEDSALCAQCHNPQNPQYGATVAGAEAARRMRARLEELKQSIELAERRVQNAEQLGMEVSGPRFDLRQAVDALTNARTLVHTFNPKPVEQELDKGLEVTDRVTRMAEEALDDYTRRRVWLAASLIPILLVVGLLLVYIRKLPPPQQEH